MISAKRRSLGSRESAANSLYFLTFNFVKVSAKERALGLGSGRTGFAHVEKQEDSVPIRENSMEQSWKQEKSRIQGPIRQE